MLLIEYLHPLLLRTINFLIIFQSIPFDGGFIGKSVEIYFNKSPDFTVYSLCI